MWYNEGGMKENWKISNTRKRCQAMIDAGIESPESYEGKHFCWQKCPYPNGCVVYEDGRSASTLRREIRVSIAKDMIAKGYSVEDIAQELRASTRSVMRYLAK